MRTLGSTKAYGGTCTLRLHTPAVVVGSIDSNTRIVSAHFKSNLIEFTKDITLHNCDLLTTDDILDYITTEIMDAVIVAHQVRQDNWVH